MYIMERESLDFVVLLPRYQWVSSGIYIVVRAVFRAKPLCYRGLAGALGRAADTHDLVALAFDIPVVYLSLPRLRLAAFAGDPVSVGDLLLADLAVVMRSRMARFFPDLVL